MCPSGEASASFCTPFLVFSPLLDSTRMRSNFELTGESFDEVISSHRPDTSNALYQMDKKAQED